MNFNGVCAARRATAAAFLAALVSPSVCSSAAADGRASAQAASGSKHYDLPATPENVQWGWYDVNEKPKLTMQFRRHRVHRDAVRTLSGRSSPGWRWKRSCGCAKENDGGGPHSITGPIYRRGAEPGDTLEIHILKIVPKPGCLQLQPAGQGISHRRAAGLRISGRVRALLQAGPGKMQTEFKPGIVIDLKPFPGTFAVGVDPNEPDAKAGPPIHDAKGRTSTLGPGRTARIWT